MSSLHGEKFMDEEPLFSVVSPDGDSEELVENADDNSADSKKSQRLCKVETRRRVEDILAQKDYLRRFADPYAEF